MASKKQENQIKIFLPTSKIEGKISEKMFDEFIFKDDVVTCIGGPATFTKAAIDILRKMGFPDERIIKFY